MDDRCELYGDDWIKNYSDTTRAAAGGTRPDVRATGATRYQFDRAFIMTNPPEKEKPSIERYLLDHPEKWREAARGQRAVMFERIRVSHGRKSKVVTGRLRLRLSTLTHMHFSRHRQLLQGQPLPRTAQGRGMHRLPAHGRVGARRAVGAARVR